MYFKVQVENQNQIHFNLMNYLLKYLIFKPRSSIENI